MYRKPIYKVCWIRIAVLLLLLAQGRGVQEGLSAQKKTLSAPEGMTQPRDSSLSTDPGVSPPQAQDMSSQKVEPQATAQSTAAATPTASQEASSFSVLLGSSGFSVRSPFKSLAKNRRLLENISVKITLMYDYRDGRSEEGLWRTSDLPGVEMARYFIKRLPDGSKCTLELALVRDSADSYEILAYGLLIDAAGQKPSPDIKEIQALFDKELQSTVNVEPNLQRLGQEIYNLSYLQADRALALLKSLGYTTIEFNQEGAETLTDKIYSPLRKGSGELPIVVKLIDATKTSLMDPSPFPPSITMPQFPGAMAAVPDIGGLFLHQSTSGEPQQRLLLLYDPDDPESLTTLLNLLRERIDVPAKQIIIEALAIELDSTKARELGISVESSSGRISTSYGLQAELTGASLPFTFLFDSNLDKLYAFKTRLSALLEKGQAEILSNPSVLVLDGRQARIQIGQQVPVVKSTATSAGIISSVDYFPVGIVLNLRPRVSEDDTQISMQVETIVSAVSQAGAETTASKVAFAPYVDNRQVQTFVRVMNNTPFIIGGLIAKEDRSTISGIPILSEIPGIGGLFRRTVASKKKKEVIVVLTPHVMPMKERAFSWVVPKDSNIFDTFGYRLFRNAYRIQAEDVFDLKFVTDSSVFQTLLNRIRLSSETDYDSKARELLDPLLKGYIPGEEILVQRMLWEIVDKAKFGQHINMDRIIFFENRPDDPSGSGFRLAFLNQKLAGLGKGQNTLSLTFEAQPKVTPEHPLAQPKCVTTYENLTADQYLLRLRKGNQRDTEGNHLNWTVVLSDTYEGIRVPPIELLRAVMVLKRILALNGRALLSLREYQAGRQIIFPSEDELRNSFHIIDRDAARLFYEVIQYYPEFEVEFNLQTQKILHILDRRKQKGA